MNRENNAQPDHRPTFQPAVDLLEGPNEIVLQVDLPGVRQEDLSLDFRAGEIHLHGKVAARHAADATARRLEYSVGDFVRSFQVADAIDAERIAAHLKDGVLTLRMPRSAAALPRRIPVSATPAAP